GSVGAEGRQAARWRSLFVVTQVALAVVLTLGAALLVQSLLKIYDVGLGFDAESTLTVDLEVSTPWVSSEWPRTVAFFEGALEEIKALPGVASAAAAHHHPINPGWSTRFTVAGQEQPSPGLEPEASFRPVTLGFFETAGIQLLRGRVFDQTTSSEGPGQVVVNQAFVDTYLEGGKALGERTVRDNWWISSIQDYEIIGVVANTRFSGRHWPPQPAMYLPHRQDVPPVMTLLVRAGPGLDPLALVPSVREAIGRVDADMPLGQISTLEELVEQTVTTRRFVTWLLSAFALVTLALAALGLYGALAYATARRTRELRLRMALGARAGHLRAMVLSQGLRLATIGVALGLLGALLTWRSPWESTM
ncbi:MAG: ABC transporter permease, partial [Acidobacteriota bacterium]